MDAYNNARVKDIGITHHNIVSHTLTVLLLGSFTIIPTTMRGLHSSLYTAIHLFFNQQ